MTHRDSVLGVVSDTLAWAERRRFILLASVVIWIATLLTLRAQHKLFWHDEIYTILGSSLPVATFWQASREGLDLSPPLNTILTHGVHALAGVGPVATRLPAMVGFCSALVAVFAIVRRRSNAVIGLVAACLLCFTPAWHYAVEARGYGLTVGCAAVALFAWSEAASLRRPSRHLALLSVAVAMGIWAHLYFVLILLPIGVGEVTRQCVRRRFDAAPWLAIAAGLIATIPVWLLASAAASQRTTFWARGIDDGVLGLYSWVFGQLRMTPFLAAIACLLALAAFTRVRSRDAHPHRPAYAAHELAAGAGLLLLPLAAWALGLVTGVVTERYATFASVAAPIVIPVLLWRLSPARTAEIVCIAATGVSCLSLTLHTVGESASRADAFEGREELALAIRSTPVSVTGGIDYLQLWYYAPADARAHVTYLADPEAALAERGSDTIDRGYLALARWTGLPAVRVSTLANARQPFLLYDCGSDWVLQSLRGMGWTTATLGRDAGGEMLRVSRRPRDEPGVTN